MSTEDSVASKKNKKYNPLPSIQYSALIPTNPSAVVAILPERENTPIAFPLIKVEYISAEYG